MSLARSRIGSAVLGVVLGGCAFALAPTRASAFAHDWHVTEIYSNTDGSVQFVEMGTLSPDETVISLASLGELSFGHSFSPNHILTESTAGRSLLFATSAFASLPGAVQPDFVIPAGFFNPNGDTLQWSTLIADPYAGGQTLWDTFTFAAGELPSNGTSSLNRALGSTTQFVAANSPTNFARQTGALVPEPGWALLLLPTILGLAASRFQKMQ